MSSFLIKIKLAPNLWLNLLSVTVKKNHYPVSSLFVCFLLFLLTDKKTTPGFPLHAIYSRALDLPQPQVTRHVRALQPGEIPAGLWVCGGPIPTDTFGGHYRQLALIGRAGISGERLIQSAASPRWKCTCWLAIQGRRRSRGESRAQPSSLFKHNLGTCWKHCRYDFILERRDLIAH